MSEIELQPLSACPSCGGAFASLKIGAVTIDRCQQCNGLWLDPLELERVLESDHATLTAHQTAHAPTDPAKAKGPCPRCGGTFIQLTDLRADVVVDSCAACYGIFLDDGELAAYDHPNLVVRLKQFWGKVLPKR